MAEVRLFQFPHSPFCLAVSQALTALNVPFDPVNVSNGNRTAIIELTAGGSYEVPVLVDGTSVVFESSSDSLDVARHIEARFGRGRLFPDSLEGLQAILIPHLENEVEGTTFRLTDLLLIPAIADPVERVLIVRHKERKFGRGCIEEWRRNRDSLYQRATGLLQPLDSMLRHTPFLLGQQPVYADFVLHGILANLTWKGGNPMPPLPRLIEWYARLGQFRYG